MKNFKELINNEFILRKENKILIYGEQSSGKTEILKQIIWQIVNNNTCCVFSNHDEIYTCCKHKENMTFLHKPNDVTKVPLNMIDPNSDYIFIDGECDNFLEILQHYKNKNICLTANKPQENLFLNNFDCIFEISKNTIK